MTISGIQKNKTLHAFYDGLAYAFDDTCARCGRKFRRTIEHAYKLGYDPIRWYCGYTCWRAAVREEEERIKKRKAEIKQRQRERARQKTEEML